MYSCQKDDDFKTVEENKTVNKAPFKISKIGKEKMDANKYLKEKLSKLQENIKKRKTNAQNKTVYSSALDFYINTDYATYIESTDSTYHSYTFAIIRTIETDYLENLLISLQPDGSYKTILLTYNITTQEKEDLLNGFQVNLLDKVNFTIIENLDVFDTLFNKTSADCYNITSDVTPCAGGYSHTHESVYNSSIGDMCGGSVTIVTSTPDYNCLDSLSGNGNTSPGNTGNTGNTGGQTTGGNDAGDSDESGDMSSPTGGDCIGPDCINLENNDDCDTSMEDLKKVFLNISDSDASTLSSVINDKGKDFGINMKEKLQHFLAQAGHEVGGFNNGFGVEENTNYTTKARLLKVFGKYYSETDTINKKKPDSYVSNPSGHANYVYCCRMGNGNEASGDGYKYRGRGIFQLTGKTNYSNFTTWYNNKYDPNKDFVSNPELLKDNDTIAILSALWYYKIRVLDKISVDTTTTVEKVTKKVNGGTNGLEDRKEIFTKAKDSINCN